MGNYPCLELKFSSSIQLKVQNFKMFILKLDKSVSTELLYYCIDEHFITYLPITSGAVQPNQGYCGL